jgi:IS30 family transposase
MEVSAQMALTKVCPAEGSINTEPKKYHHITYEDRVQIEGYMKAGLEAAEMAALIGCSERTVKRELANSWEEKQSDWTFKMRYTYDYAQLRHEERGAKKGRKPKLKSNPELVKYLEEKIKKDQYSPEAALFSAQEEETIVVDVAVKTVYNAIDRGELGKVKRRDLWRKEGWRKEKSQSRKGSHTRGSSIDLRPEAANDRSEPGHWEMDLIVGKQGTKPALLTLTDRCTRQEIIEKLPNKEQASVKTALDRLERKGLHFKTVTSDNGSEFLDFQALEASVNGGLRFQMYYAHPYSSWERASNENANGIIRRFFPKGTDFSKVSKRNILHTQSWINNYPRKIFGGRSALAFLNRLDN